MVRFTAVRPRRARSCASAGSEHQWRHYRLYGKLDDCEHVRELFATCMSLKAALPGTKRTQVGDQKSIGAPRFLRCDRHALLSVHDRCVLAQLLIAKTEPYRNTVFAYRPLPEQATAER